MYAIVWRRSNLIEMKKMLIMAHAGGMEHGPENSLAAVKECLKFKPDIIELDIRRSSDNILFCYHGFGIFIYFLAYFLRYLKFATIKKLFKIDSLEEILNVVDEPTIIYLNLKDYVITAAQIDDLHRQYPHLEFWLGMSDNKKVAELKKDLKHQYQFHCTWPNILSFKMALKNSLKNHLHSIKLLPWQCTPANLNLVKKHQLAHIVEPIFITNKGFAKLTEKYGSLYKCLNDLNKPEDVTSIYKYL